MSGGASPGTCSVAEPLLLLLQGSCLFLCQAVLCVKCSHEKSLSLEAALLTCLYSVHGPWESRVGVPYVVRSKEGAQKGLTRHRVRGVGFSLQNRGTYSSEAVADCHFMLF